MFSDILDARPIPEDIVEAAREWAEYELNRIYGKKTSLYVPSLQGEAERMLKDRLGKEWKKYHKVEVSVSSINGTRNIKVDIKEWK